MSGLLSRRTLRNCEMFGGGLLLLHAQSGRCYPLDCKGSPRYLALSEFGGKIRERVGVQGELALEGTIRDALALPEKRDDLIQNGIKVHTRLPLPVAVRGCP